ncbi:hypothetical protein ROZALSC1DRAFT_26909 [Rozella allomycis CSF55]|uniref:F-box domain-containing protein n=1 Tax=Rozella allomycis (strain CSF55) TaxID=988480 RepID=A0A075AWA1_ROZAC|nr:hypothetical protein O9G_001786 [Rozella allomycis CSF55]RKP21707.1 hypothetical protein ROZALSC1DRAFT_26909 [Rozella allomycis CSF55]|eukprot:EPZ34530.1 hypothetical protein O9G_001786 [Rozella allomycis CSF55]
MESMSSEEASVPDSMEMDATAQDTSNENMPTPNEMAFTLQPASSELRLENKKGMPPEILIEILSYLDVKSFINLRGASKDLSNVTKLVNDKFFEVQTKYAAYLEGLIKPIVQKVILETNEYEKDQRKKIILKNWFNIDEFYDPLVVWIDRPSSIIRRCLKYLFSKPSHIVGITNRIQSPEFYVFLVNSFSMGDKEVMQVLFEELRKSDSVNIVDLIECIIRYVPDAEMARDGAPRRLIYKILGLGYRAIDLENETLLTIPQSIDFESLLNDCVKRSAYVTLKYVRNQVPQETRLWDQNLLLRILEHDNFFFLKKFFDGRYNFIRIVSDKIIENFYEKACELNAIEILINSCLLKENRDFDEPSRMITLGTVAGISHETTRKLLKSYYDFAPMTVSSLTYLLNFLKNDIENIDNFSDENVGNNQNHGPVKGLIKKVGNVEFFKELAEKFFFFDFPNLPEPNNDIRQLCAAVGSTFLKICEKLDVQVYNELLCALFTSLPVKHIQIINTHYGIRTSVALKLVYQKLSAERKREIAAALPDLRLNL